MGKIAYVVPRVDRAFQDLKRAKRVGNKQRASIALDDAFKPIADACRNPNYHWDKEDEDALDDLVNKYDPKGDDEQE